MNLLSPVSSPWRRPLVVLLAMSLLIASACDSSPDGSPDAGSPAPGSSTPAETREPGPTSPLFGQPPPLDPCQLLHATEIQSVLEGGFLTTEQETSRGAAYSCIYETEDRENRVAVTVRKPPMDLEEFIERMEEFGDRARGIDDLSEPAVLVVFGPTATVYTLRDGVQFYIDVVRANRSGGDIAPLALGLMERALARLAAEEAEGLGGLGSG